MEKSPVVSGMRAGLRARAAFACMLVCCAALSVSLAAARPAVAVAEEVAAAGTAELSEPLAGGYVTVSGAEGIDAAAQYATLNEAAAALALSPSVSADATGVAIVIHGTVELAGQVELVVPAGAQGVGIVGDGADAQVVTPADGSAGLSSTGGALVARGLSISGPVSLTSAADLSVDGCSLSSTLAATAFGAVSVCGNTFSSYAVEAPALSATLATSDASLVFSGNVVTGYAGGLSVALAEGVTRPAVSVSGNSFTLGEGTSSPTRAALTLGGSLWTPSSVTFDGNAIEAATCLVLLDASFGVENAQTVTDPAAPASLTLLDGTLDAGGVASVFELVGRGSGEASASSTPVALSSALTDADPAKADVASQACAILFPDEYLDVVAVVPGSEAIAAEGDVADVSAAAQPFAEAAAMCTVSYDANGASAGVAPEAASVATGSTVTVASAASLVNAGYEFQGWNTAADGSGAFYAVGQVFVPSCDVTLYAQWTPTGTVATVNVTITAGE